MQTYHNQGGIIQGRAQLVREYVSNLQDNTEALRSNFSGASAPANPAVGQKYFNVSNNVTYVYNGTTWIPDDDTTATHTEVVKARGQMNDLKSRLDVSMNPDGTLKNPLEANVDEWKTPALTISYLSGTSFTTSNDMTTVFTKGRGLKLYNGTNTVYSSVASSEYNSQYNVTTVTINDSVVSSNIKSVEYSIIQNSIVPSTSTKRNVPVSVGTTATADSLPAGYFLECTTVGTTGATTPVITTPTVGATVTDGTVVWTIRKVANTTDATTTTHGLMSAADKTKLNGIATNANNYSLPTASASVKGGIKVGSGLSMNGDTLSSTYSYTLPTASASVKGGIKVGGGLSMNGDTLNTNIAVATTSANGLMSASDKTKLNGIATNANNYSLPTATSSTLGGVKIGSGLSISDGVVSISGSTSTPVGTVIAFAGSSTPSGYLLCDGSAISRTTYSALYSVIGTTYGAGNGSTTFNLPNLTDKFIEGSTVAGTIKQAGLPNIKGTMSQIECRGNSSGTGAITVKTSTANPVNSGSGYYAYNLDFNASRSSAIYSDSVTTVQPPALTMRYIIKYQ